MLQCQLYHYQKDLIYMTLLILLELEHAPDSFFALFGSSLWAEVVYMFTLLYIVILSFTWI